ncbi:MAG: T9SS type A sorting domain-containing protein [Fluviicola sp.]
MKKTLLLLFMVSLVSTTFGQISFYRLFGGEDFDYAYDVVELPDSGYLIAGTSGSFNVGHADAFLIRTDKYANRIWSVPYGSPENDGAFDLEHKEGFGTYILGRTTAPEGDFDTWIAFVDDQGSVIWERSYPGPDWEEAVASAMTLDSGLFVAVNRYGTGTQGTDYSLMRLNIAGDTIWTQEVNAIGDNEVTNIEPYHDSLFLVSSNHWDTLNQQAYGRIEVIHENGSLMWSDTVGIATGSSYFNDFFEVNDTLYGVGSYKLDDTSTFNRVRHVRYLPLAENGEILTEMSISAGNMIDDVVCPIPNSGLKYSSFRFQDPMGTSSNYDFYIGLNSFALTPIGGTANTVTDGEDRLFNAEPTLDGGAIFVGYQSLPNGGTAMCMLKIGPGFDYPIVPETPFIQQLVGQEDLGVLANILVYPNPASSEIIIDNGNQTLDRCELVNLEGKVLSTGKISGPQTTFVVEGIQSGMYFLQFFNKDAFLGAKQILIQ